MLSFVWVLKGIRVFNLEQDSRMKRDFCLKQSQVLKASTEHFYPDFSRDPPSPPPPVSSQHAFHYHITNSYQQFIGCS